MTKDEATALFRALVARHGLHWTAAVPRPAWDQLAAVNAVLDADDRRAALGLPRRR